MPTVVTNVMGSVCARLREGPHEPVSDSHQPSATPGQVTRLIAKLVIGHATSLFLVLDGLSKPSLRHRQCDSALSTSMNQNQIALVYSSAFLILTSRSSLEVKPRWSRRRWCCCPKDTSSKPFSASRRFLWQFMSERSNHIYGPVILFMTLWRPAI